MSNSTPLNQKAVSFVVPALNEAECLADTINEIMQAVEFLDAYQIILVDDGSADETYSIMEKMSEENTNIQVLSHGENLGMGAAYKSGLKQAVYPYYMLIPGDNGYRVDSIEKILSKLGAADIIIPFHQNLKEVRSWNRLLISKLFTELANWCAGLNIPYYNGTVIHRTELLRRINIHTDSFAYQLEALVKLLWLGSSFETVGIDIQKRREGKTKAFKIKNIVQVLKVFTRLLAIKGNVLSINDNASEK